jgi:hypothetical protein
VRNSYEKSIEIIKNVIEATRKKEQSSKTWVTIMIAYECPNKEHQSILKRPEAEQGTIKVQGTRE